MGHIVQSVITELRTESRPASRFTGKRVHFIGIGGCGMNGLARILMDCGAIVTGSEPHPTAQTFDLIKRGARISRTQGGELLSRDIDLVVRTAAIPDDNPEFAASRALGIQSMKYAQMLGQVMAERFGVAIAGTHGKSTTTAMTAFALTRCGVDPSFVIGGTVPQLGGVGAHSGSSAIFVAEACEYDRSFHNLHPTIAVITNIEEDHLDCYRDIDEIVDAFARFAALVPPHGLIVTSATDFNCRRALRGIGARIETVALADEHTAQADWLIRDTGIAAGCHTADLFYRGDVVGRLQLAVPGRHNLMNATMALAVCNACGIDLQKAIAALGQFTGVDRRMSEMGRCNNALLVDDYGHHPTEIRATLAAVREKYQPRRLICVFQPHQHSRTRFLLEDFAASFELADQTIVADIYFVRDSQAEKQRISAKDLVERINRHGQRALHIAHMPDIVAHLKQELREGDVLLTMGAGNIWEICRDLAE